ncbi:MAG: 2OG-Fe(II) oxygenase [Actinomycetota bacterium]|nr:2OG-Fe(II) oxygenase [Actinomycetota bacterium]
MSVDQEVRGGGAAAGWPEPFRYSPDGAGDPEPPYAVADAWAPPHPLALPEGLCYRLRAAALCAPLRGLSDTGTYLTVDLDPGDEQQILDRIRAANAAWWGLEVSEWLLMGKSYRPGDQHAEHQDVYAGAARRKLGAIVQLSDPAEYRGGALRVRVGAGTVELPRALGTLAAWPGWTLHGVEPVTAGERQVLAIFGYGPALR